MAEKTVLSEKQIEDIVSLYVFDKKSTTDIANKFRLGPTVIRRVLIQNGVALRTRSEGINEARHKLGVHLIGVKRNFSEEHKTNISKARLLREDELASGVSLKPSGYIAITRGENLDRSAHIVVMEEFIGRKLRENEVVHHIDHNQTNNDIHNLALLTREAHARLHRFEEELCGFKAKRNKFGQLTNEVEQCQ